MRIPKSFAAEAKLKQGSEVEVSPRDGELVVSLVAEPQFSLAHLLRGITEENRHHEVDTGVPAGSEAW